MSRQDNHPDPVLLRAARVVLPGEVWEGASVLAEGGRVARIFKDGESLPDGRARVHDLPGHTLYPGFIDLHIHGAAGVDTMEATAAELGRVARFLAAHGVTGWLPTLVPAPDEDYARAVAAIDGLTGAPAQGAGGARALGVHYEGPFVNTAQCGALRTAYFRVFRGAASLEGLPRLARAGAAHMITVAPEIEGGIELVAELKARGWIVSLGHTRADAATLDAARAAGATHMTHFFNAMRQLHHRDPGPVGWGLASDAVTCDVIADGVHCDPLLLRVALRCKTAARLALISDSVAPAGLGDGEFRVWGETITVEGGRTANARGSIAGSVITVLDAVRRMLALGASPVEVAAMAAHTPARVLGLADACGSIEPGKRADLVALDTEGRASLTLVGGRVAHGALSS
ncbi:MAG: N-acetylglucosamine-6-phosphate deacetylase [Acidobacteria bacterium]|nr:N-acetylglucosamine-6-phosphate deacetylase [Acidobacteriota bacterium]